MRGSVAVVCPFAGSREAGIVAAGLLSRIARASGDEIVLVDNTPEGVLRDLGPSHVDARIVSAPHQQSSYYARNIGAESTTAEWLLFMDADCVPEPSILDEYFAEPIPDDCGALAGAIVGVSSQAGLLARYARARGILDQKRLAHQERPFGATANLLVRRTAWADVGGFLEGIRSGGDVDFCWRLQAAGWKLSYRDGARVEHIHRERLGPLVSQYVRYGAGRAWLERRYPDVPRASRHVALLLAAPALIAGNVLRGRREQAAYRALDEAIVVGGLFGRFRENRAGGSAEPLTNADLALVTRVFPDDAAMSAVGGFERQGRTVWVVASRRALRIPASAVRDLDVTFLEDDGVARRLVAFVWFVARHPVAAMRLAATPRSALGGLGMTASLAHRLARRKVRIISCADDDERVVLGVRHLARRLGVGCQLSGDRRPRGVGSGVSTAHDEGDAG